MKILITVELYEYCNYNSVMNKNKISKLNKNNQTKQVVQHCPKLVQFGYMAYSGCKKNSK